MNQRSNTKDTPAIDALQIKIALLRKGQSIRAWAAENGFAHPTVIRAIHGHKSNGPRINRARRLLEKLIKNQPGGNDAKKEN